LARTTWVALKKAFELESTVTGIKNVEVRFKRGEAGNTINMLSQVMESPEQFEKGSFFEHTFGERQIFLVRDP